MRKKLSVIIPAYNEEKVIEGCLQSLAKQDYPNFEVVVVDDGSNDSSQTVIKNLKLEIKNLTFLKQSHLGPGAARNLGANNATGEILVFVDADMEFESDFLTKLVAPIQIGKAIGTFSSEEYLLNKDNVWAKCWALNMSGRSDKIAVGDMSKKNNTLYGKGKDFFEKLEKQNEKIQFSQESSHVFRAITKNKFNEAGGFDTKIGYTDDWSLSRKLKAFAQASPGAKYYHRNPESIEEVWKQARWYGKNEFLTRNSVRRLYNLVRYFPFFGLANGIIVAIKYREINFVIFKAVYDAAVWTSVLLSFFGERKSK